MGTRRLLERAWQTSSAKGTGVISSSPAKYGMMLTDPSSSGQLHDIEKNIKQKTLPFGNLMRSQVLYQAALQGAA